MLNFFSSHKPSDNHQGLSTTELLNACTSSPPEELGSLLDKHHQSLLDACAQNPNVETTAILLSHLNLSTVYKSEPGLRRRPNSLTPQQYVLERAAFHGNATLVSHLVNTHPDLDLFDETLGRRALHGGVKVWKVLLEKESKLKDARWGHAGMVDEHCVMQENVDVLRLLLQQGAKMESQARPILQIAEIAESPEEIKCLLREYGADEGWREHVGGNE